MNHKHTQSPTVGGFEARRSPRREDSRPAWVYVGSGSVEAQVKDVSGEGACFILARPIAAGKPIRFQIGHGTTRTEHEGMILRSQQCPDGRFEVGVRFDTCHIGPATRFPGRASPVVVG